MDNNLNPDEYYDLGYHPSPSSMETTRYSTLGDDLLQYGQTSSETSAFLNPTDENSCSNKPSSTLGWLPAKSVTHIEAVHTRLGMKQHTNVINKKPDDQGAVYSEMMKERLSKLLLGEDMSGSGKGVCTAVAISNAITNLYATVFGQNLRLEPLPPEKKFMWRREMDSLLSVCDYMVEFIPTSQIFQDGKTVEVMTSGPRSDISINLPALQMLDTMLLEILESFQETEFCYVDQENLSSNMKHSGSFRKAIHRKAEKWWLPVPCVPRGGLSEKSKKQLQQKRDCTNQIHKAAMAINSSILAEMKVPDTYMAALPKSRKASVGDAIYRFMSTTDKFSSDDVLDCLNITSEHEALEIADRIEASMNTWRHKACMSHSKSSWDMIKDLMADGNKNYILVNRAENLLLCLKQRYPELPQTTLDACKIQYNRDVGQAILESYSRVLEGLAFNIVDRIDDVLYADKYVKQQD